MIAELHWAYTIATLLLAVMGVLGVCAGLYLLIEVVLEHHAKRQLAAWRVLPAPVIRQDKFSRLKKAKPLPSLVR